MAIATATAKRVIAAEEDTNRYQGVPMPGMLVKAVLIWHQIWAVD